MANRFVDATLRLVDKFSSPLSKATAEMQAKGRQIQKTANSIKRTGKNLESVGTSLEKKVTVPIIGIMAASGKMADTFEKDMGQVNTLLDNHNHLKSYKNMAIKTSNETGIALHTISEGVYQMISSIGDSGTKTQKIFNVAAKAAKGGGSSVQESVALISSAMKGYDSVNVKTAQSISDMAFQTQKLGVTTYKELAASMQPLFPLGKSLNVSYQELFGSMATLTGVTSNSRALTAALALTGSQYETFKEKTAKMGKAQGSTEKALQDMQTSMSKLRKTINVVKNSLTVFGSAVLQVVVQPATKAANKLSELTDRFSKLSPETQKFIVKVALIVAAVGPAIVIIAKLTQGVGALYWNVGRMIKTVQGAESFASLITPGGKIVLILTGIAIAAVLVYKNWNKITAAAKNMQKTAVTALNAAGVDTKKLGSTVKSIAKTASSAFGTIGKGAGKIISGLRPVATFLSGAFKKAFTIVLSFVVARYSGWLKSTIDVVHGVTTAFKGIIEFISGVFTGNWKKAWNGVKNIFKGAFEALVGIAKAPLNTVIGLVNTAISGLNKVSVKIPSWVPGKYGGKQYGINIPKIPMLAKGTNNWSGGIAQINEKGGEIVDLPRGSRVYPHDASVRMARNEGKKVYKIEKLADTIIVREEADIDKIAERIADKLEAVPA